MLNNLPKDQDKVFKDSLRHFAR